MKTHSDSHTYVTRHGFVIEEVISGCAPACGKRLTVYRSEDWEPFSGATESLTVGQCSGWETLDGHCSICDRDTKYRQLLVVTHAETTTVATESLRSY